MTRPKRGPAPVTSLAVRIAVVALTLGTVVLAAIDNAGLPGTLLVLFVVPMSLAYALVGSMIVARHPGNAIGWILCFVGLSVAVTGFKEHYVFLSVMGPRNLPATVAVAWLGNVLPLLALMTLPLVFLLFPDGHLPTRRWRPVLWTTLAAGTLMWVFFVISPGPLGSTLLRVEQIPNPTAITIGSEATGDGVFFAFLGVFLVLAASSVASTVALVLRFRRSRGEVRQQLRWLAFVGGFLGLLLVLLVIASFIGGGERWGNILLLTFLVAMGFGVPAACGIAIMKYRLYDFDLVLKKAVVFAILAATITLVYVVVVVALPTLIVGTGGSGTFDVFSFAAALIAALAFNPVRRGARKLANRLVYGNRATPYEVLAEFSGHVGEAYADDDVLPKMAQILAEGTGADSAVVWLKIGNAMRPEASWPADAQHPPRLPDDAATVTHRGETLGALSVRLPANDPMDAEKAKLVADLAGQAGLVLRNVRLIEDLRRSRQRLVAAQDEERRKIERNLHDGAQQQLIALGIKANLAERLLASDPAKTGEMLAAIKTELQDAVETLRDLARGIYPPLLADQGLVAALDAQARKVAVPVELEATNIARYPQETEAAVYFCTLEALQNVAKYADASQVRLRLSASDGVLTFSVQDDGAGFDIDAASHGTGLQGMADRLDAIGGALDIRSASGEGTTLTGQIPARAEVP